MVRKDPMGSILPTTSSSSSSSNSSTSSNHSTHMSNHSLPSTGHTTNSNHVTSSSSSSSDDRHTGNNTPFAPLNSNNNHNSNHHQSLYNHTKPLGYNVSKPIVTIQLSGASSSSSSSRSNLRCVHSSIIHTLAVSLYRIRTQSITYHTLYKHHVESNLSVTTITTTHYAYLNLILIAPYPLFLALIP